MIILKSFELLSAALQHAFNIIFGLNWAPLNSYQLIIFRQMDLICFIWRSLGQNGTFLLKGVINTFLCSTGVLNTDNSSLDTNTYPSSPCGHMDLPSKLSFIFERKWRKYRTLLHIVTLSERINTTYYSTVWVVQNFKICVFGKKRIWTLHSLVFPILCNTNPEYPLNCNGATCVSWNSLCLVSIQSK